MGGAVSSGQDNDELVDNLLEASYIKSPNVEQVFRIVDRAHYYLSEYKHSAYKDLAWKSGTLHLSAPCIYSEVMEALELKPGMSFLNLGSGTGYLNTMVGYVIGPYGINHGVELHEDNVTYAQEKLDSFRESCYKFDDLELGEPQFVVGNCLNLAAENRLYDRVYCGAGCPTEQKEFIQGLVKIGGIVVVPVGDQLLKIHRESETDFSSDSVLPVSFASLILPIKDREYEPIVLPEVNPLSLQCICRIGIRDSIRKTFNFEQRTEESVIQPSKSRIRILKHIRPTPEGLVIMRRSSDIEDHLEDEEDDDGSDSDIPEGHLPIQIQELIRWGQRFPGFDPDRNTSDVDSDLSDVEEQSAAREQERPATGNGNNNGQGTPSHSDSLHRIPEAMESEEDWETADDDERGKSKLQENHNKEENISDNGNKREKGKAELAGVENMEFEARSKTVSVSSNSPMDPFLVEDKGDPLPGTDDGINDSMSSDGEEDSQVSGAPVPILQSSLPTELSQPRTINKSYSTSADTSETSGFGSLGEEIPTLGSQLSTDGSLKDDLSDSIAELSKSEKEGDVFMSASPPTLQTLEDGDGLAQESSTEADIVYMHDDGDEDDEEDDSDDSDSDSDFIRRSSSNQVLRTPASFLEDNDSDEEDQDEHKDRPPRGPDFTAFLKEKVDTLPIPSTLKAFILHYR